MSSKRSFILLFAGINIADVRREILSSHRNETGGENNGAQTTPVMDRARSLLELAKYAQIPSTFINCETFISRTNLLCWHCSLPFGGIPRFIAIDFRPINGAQIPPRSLSTSCAESPRNPAQCEWNIEGNFCSWACASAYIDTHYKGSKNWTLQHNLAIVRAQFESCPILPVRPAPARTVMRAYCGACGMSQQEYEHTVAELSKAPTSHNGHR